MDAITQYLLEWAEQYFRSRDAYYKKILSINTQEGKLKITYKDREEMIMAAADLSTAEAAPNSAIITLNSRKNVDTLHQNWKKFSSIENLKIYFINLLSTLEKKWIISPSVHAKISEESALLLGLKAMFETVEPITEEILLARLKNP